MNTNFTQLDALSGDDYGAVYSASMAWAAAPFDAAAVGVAGFLQATPRPGTATGNLTAINIEARRRWAEAQGRMIRAGGDMLAVNDGSTLACMVRDVAMFTKTDDVAIGQLIRIARGNIAAASTTVETGKLPAMLEHTPNTRNDEHPGLWFTPKLDPRQADSVLQVAHETLTATADACNRGAVTPARLDQVAIATGHIEMAFNHLERTHTIYDFTEGLPELDFPTPAQWPMQAPTRTHTPPSTANTLAAQASAAPTAQAAATPAVNPAAPAIQPQPAMAAAKTL